MWNSKTVRFTKFLNRGREFKPLISRTTGIEPDIMGILDEVLYWVLLSLVCGMLPFLALGAKYTISHHDNPKYSPALPNTIR